VTKRRGHFCWCCARTRPNESFSGGGHARHLCKECHKLGGEELAYRQAVRNIDGMVQWETGRVKRKQRANLARYLTDPNERIRRHAEGVVARDARPVAAEGEGLDGLLDWSVHRDSKGSTTKDTEVAESSSPRAPGRPAGTTTQDTGATVELVVKYLRSHPASTGEEARKNLGLVKHTWNARVSRAIKEGKVRKEGDRRATRYWAT